MHRRTTWVAVVTGMTVLVPAALPATPAGAGLTLTGAGVPDAALATSPGSRPVLSLGAEGDAVRALQRRLRARRAGITVDGRFGPATRRAVLRLQAGRGLEADGIVGPRTWQALDDDGPSLASDSTGTGRSGKPTLRLGSTGPAVTEAQQLLTRAGQRTSSDGRFGPRTSGAAVAFQRARGLGADGIVGPATWVALGARPAAPPAVTMVRAATPGPWRTIGARTRTVARGDTLASVAAATKSTPSALATANRLAPGSRLPVGSTLMVPGSWRCVVPGGGFINDYGFVRAAGRTHEGNDLFAVRGARVVAPVAGRVERKEGPIGGRTVTLHGRDGNRYYFAHLESYGATGQVSAGREIGYVGNSGNAVTTPPHLHFEIHPGGGAAVNPFPTLTLACKR